MFSPLLALAIQARQVLGPFVGAVEPRRARVFAWVEGGRIDAKLELEGADGARLREIDAQVPSGNEDFATWVVDGLEPARTYGLSFCGRHRWLSTPVEEGQPARVALAFGSIAEGTTGAPNPAWDSFRKDAPDALVLIGDAPALDFADPAGLSSKAREFLAAPDLASLLSMTSLYVFQGAREPALGGVRRGPVDAFPIDAPREWLERELERSKAPFKLLVSAGPATVVPPFLAEKKIAGVVLVGDPQPFLLVTADSRNSPAVLTASFRSAAGGELSRIEIRADELDPLHPRPLAGPAGARLQGATRTPADLVFLGDSTTEGWTGAGATVWARRYARRRAAALGFAGAGASTVAARIEEGALDGLSPKLVVLLVGTNDTNGDRTRGRSASARQIADGVLGVVARIRGKLPEAKILLLAIFPRDEGPSPRRNKIAEANRLLAEGADGKNVRFLDLGARFLDKDGKISRDDMPDFVHLSPRGYEIWAEAIEPAVRELLGEK